MSLLLLLTACNHHADTADSGDTADTDWTEEVALTTEGGTYYVMYSPTPDPIPFNEPFSMYWMAHDGADHGVMFEDADLALDITMPEHGHGMNTVPTVTRDEMGGFDVTGSLFHMRGWWAMQATVTRGEVVESATFYVECCEG